MAFLYGFAIVAGLLNALQSGANASLSKAVQQPFLAALVVVAMSATSIAVAGLVSGRLGWPQAGAWGDVPGWAWIGGMFCAILVMSQLLVAQQIGAGPYMGLVVTAGVLMSLALDHFGWMGFKEHAINVWRAVGAVLMVAGVALVARF